MPAAAPAPHAGWMRLLLATAVVAAAAADSPDCPVSAFMCSANSSGLATPDWCRGNNPVLVAIPPSRLASVSTDMATYQRVYSCDSTDPFSSCALIDNFFAGEYPVGPAPNASTIKLVVVAGRDGLNGVNASLALYDAQFNFITAPVVDFQGRLNLLDAQPNPATNGSTTLVGYGGTTRLNYYNASDNACAERGCMQVNLVEMNAGVNLTTYSEAFIPCGGYYEVNAIAVSVNFFSVQLGVAGVAAARDAWSSRSMPAFERGSTLASVRPVQHGSDGNVEFGVGSAAAGAASPAPPSAAEVPPLGDQIRLDPAAPQSFVTSLVYNSDPTNPYYGWSLLFGQYFGPNSPACLATQNVTSQCFVMIARWQIRRNGQQIPQQPPLQLATTTTYNNCSLSDGASQGMAASIDPFYNSDNCAGATQLLFIVTNTTVSTFAFAPVHPMTIDIANSPAARTFDSTTIAPAGAATISAVAVWSEVVVANPPTAPGPAVIKPSSVWLAVSTQATNATGSSGGSGSETFLANSSMSTFVMRLPQFSDAVLGASGGSGNCTVYPPQLQPTILNPAGVPPAGQSCGWIEYWNGVQCVLQPYDTLALQWANPVTALQVRWRGTPAAAAILLEQAGCPVWNTTCIANWLNTTMSSSSSPASSTLNFGSRAVAPLQLTRPAAAQRYARMRPDERVSLKRQWIALHSTLEDSGSNAAALDLMKEYYGNRHLLFASLTNPTLLVFEMVPLGCLNASGTTALVSSFDNEIALLGPLRTLHVSNNAQYAFGAVDRQRFVLASMERMVEVCNALAANPSDPFLQSYAGACAGSAATGGQKPRLPAVADFLQVVSTCISGSYCPSFNTEVVQQQPAGHYSIYGYDSLPAEPGSIATLGMRLACPQGFICPEYGMTLPVPCSADGTLSLSCYESGLSQPLVCPNGTICGLPVVPPIPAPPGYAQDVDVASQQRTLTLCPPGEWCGVGRAVSEGVDALACPEASFCTTPDVLEPAVCNMGGNCTASSCPEMSYCPPGSVSENLCPAGSYCPSPTEALPCSPGSYCPAGSPLWSLCGAGFFCPNASVELRCPPGAYCLQGSVQYTVCPKISHCYCDNPNSGCAAPPYSYMLAIVGMIAFIALVFYVAWVCKLRAIWRTKRAACRKQQRERSKRAAARYSIPSIQMMPRRQGSALGIVDEDGTGMYAPMLGSEPSSTGVHTSSLQLTGAGAAAAPLLPTVSSASLNGGGADDAIGLTRLPSASSEMSVGTDVSTPSSFGNRFSAAFAAAPIRSRLSRRGSTRLMMQRQKFTVDIRFTKLGLRLNTGDKRSVLSGVTGELRHGRVCAVMGPSGAGKTTFLTALCGKASYGTLSGSVMINGEPGLLTDAKYKHLVAFVPQEDIMMRDLTVEENIAFAALTRLPNSWDVDRKLAFADSVIDILGLDEIRDSLIGDENVRGISGGQRKRVNVGIQMAAQPSVLFLDEPTSGLDATGSLAVCNALKKIADLGITVALVLHQPRFEIFMQFSDLLLLGKGGKTVYMGPVVDALPYFERALSITCPPRINPADFMLDCVGGDVPADWKAAHPDFVPQQLFDLWEAETATSDAPSSSATSSALAIASASGAVGLPDARVQSVTSTSSADASAPAKQPPRHEPPSFLALVWLFFRRSVSQQLRHPFTFVLNNALVLVAAIFLALVYFGDPSYGPPEPIEAFSGCAPQVATGCQICLAESKDTVLNRAVMTAIGLSLTGVASFLPVFGSERIVFFREASELPQPLHTLAYFTGKDLSMIPQLLIGPFVFCTAYQALTAPRATFGEYYAVFFACYWCASAFAYLVTVLSPAALAQLLGVVVIFSNAQFGGGAPTLKQLQAKFIPLCYLPSLSYIRYALEALYVMEVSPYEQIVALQGLDLSSIVSSTFGFDLASFGKNLGIVLAIGVIVRLLALVAMIAKDRHKKK